MDQWEFDCPQFVDFSAGLQNDCMDNVFCDTPNNEELVPNEKYHSNAKCYLQRMATPKLRPPVQTLKNSPFVKVTRPAATDDEKAAALGKLPSRLSKSDGCLNKGIKNLKVKENPPLKSLQKKSLSDSNIRKKRTAHNYLKQTSQKGKSTEELELERIAELQNLLHQHLRLNRLNLKRMKMNKPPFMLKSLFKKNNQGLKSKNKEAVDLRVPIKPAFRKVKCHSEKTCDNMPLHKETIGNFKRMNTEVDHMKMQGTKKVLRDLNGLDNKVHFESYKGHNGLKFLPKQKETFPVSFSFDKSGPSPFNTSLRVINK